MRNYAIAAAFLAAVHLPAFAAHSANLEDKYQFDEFETVERFNTWTINSWQAIDQKSLIIRTSPSKAYLLILNRRLPDLRFGQAIRLSSTGSTVHAKFDTVGTLGRRYRSIPASIAKIYKLNGKEERRFVKQQIRGD